MLDKSYIIIQFYIFKHYPWEIDRENNDKWYKLYMVWFINIRKEKLSSKLNNKKPS